MALIATQAANRLIVIMVVNLDCLRPEPHGYFSVIPKYFYD
jgi:hypothetical protein